MAELFKNENVGVAEAAPRTVNAEIIQPEPTGMAMIPATVGVPEREQTPQGLALRDFRSGFMMLDPERMKAALTEYDARRDTFRDWLLSKLIVGLHFGFPPGCEPRKNAAGQVVDKKGNVVPDSSWRSKPSLYKAGADFVCDLLGVRDEYRPDSEGWIQAGSNAGTFVSVCTLHSRMTAEVVGMGRGLAKTADEQLGANSALKKSEKRAKVAAVLNAYSLADLFSQDLEDGPPGPSNETPAAKPGAPKSHPRGKRAEKIDLESLLGAFKACRPPDERNPESFALFASHHTKLEYTAETVTKLSNWTKEDIEGCRKALEDNQ